MNNKEVAQAFHDRILNEHRYDEAEILVDSGVVFRINRSEPLQGMEAFKNYIGVLHHAFPDLKYSTSFIYQDDDEEAVTLHWRCKGTHENNLGDIPATGKIVENSGLSVFHLKNGRITENIIYYNEAEIAKQMGAF